MSPNTLRQSPGWIAAIAALAVLGACGSSPSEPPDAASTAGFIATDFEPPTAVVGPGFELRPLGPALVQVDFDAYMSSIEHLQTTFTRSTAWPHEGITDADAMLDMETEQGRFERRESFAYAVLTPDGTRERGCVYVYPSDKAGYDAKVRLWTTKAEYDAGFDGELYAWVTDWVAEEWPFETVAYPGRSVPWDEWDSLPEQ
ncbi:MAG: twin-arginine translocation pathway signal protein [Pseudomonadota bacterium]